MTDNMLISYLLISGTLLCFIAFVWSAKGWINLIIKCMYMLATFWAAIMIALVLLS